MCSLCDSSGDVPTMNVDQRFRVAFLTKSLCPQWIKRGKREFGPIREGQTGKLPVDVQRSAPKFPARPMYLYQKGSSALFLCPEAMGSGQWAVDSGQWTVDSEQVAEGGEKVCM
jgi:hypothetical protein